MSRRTLEQVGETPTPQELYTRLTSREGWPYKEDQEYFLCRDRALVSALYVGELRVSEALRIEWQQFEPSQDILLCHDVLLSKTKGKPRYRELKLPLHGERACFTELIQDYLSTMADRYKEEVLQKRLFPWSLEVRKIQVGDYHWKNEPGKVTPLWSVKMVGTVRAWQIVMALLPEMTQHWLRVYGEKYLYQMFGKDPIAVAKVVKVDPRTVVKYLMAGTEDYPVV